VPKYSIKSLSITILSMLTLSMTLSITTLSIMTLRITFSITTSRVMTLSTNTLMSTKMLSIMTPRIPMHSIMTLSIITLIYAEYNNTQDNEAKHRHSA